MSEIGAGATVGSASGLAIVPLAGGGPAATVRVGTFPDALAVAGQTAYVASYVDDSVTPVDLETGRAGRPIPAGPGPAAIAVAPDGRMAYVTDAGTSPLGHTVTPIDLATRRALPPIDVGAGPQGIAITPDGSTAYVADAGAIVSGQSGPIGHTVTPIDLATRRALPPIDVGNAPVAVAVSPDGHAAYVANANSGSVSPISVSTGRAGPAIAVPGAPQALALSGSTLYVALGRSGVAPGDSVVAIDLGTGRAGTPVGVGPTPTALAVHGSRVYVVCYGSSAVVPVTFVHGAAQVGRPIHVPDGPYAIALALVRVPRGRSAGASARVLAGHSSAGRAAPGRAPQGAQRARPKR